MSGREGGKWGGGETFIPPERQHGFRGQLHRNWHRKAQFPGLHSHRELWTAELLGGCQPVPGRALLQWHTCWVSRFNCHHCMAESVLAGQAQAAAEPLCLLPHSPGLLWCPEPLLSTWVGLPLAASAPSPWTVCHGLNSSGASAQAHWEQTLPLPSVMLLSRWGSLRSYYRMVL